MLTRIYCGVWDFRYVVWLGWLPPHLLDSNAHSIYEFLRKYEGRFVKGGAIACATEMSVAKASIERYMEICATVPMVKALYHAKGDLTYLVTGRPKAVPPKQAAQRALRIGAHSFGL